MNYLDPYVDALRSYWSLSKSLRVVFDASNGVAGIVIPHLVKNVPMLESILINMTPDPNFSAHGPNPLLPGALEDCKKKIHDHNADLGVVIDADGDRAVFVDDEGNMIDPYIVVLLMMRALKPPIVVDEPLYTLLSWLDVIPKKDLIRSKVGYINIKEHMRARHAAFGAEQSGHYFFSDFFYIDSGLMTAIRCINMLSLLDVKASAFSAQYQLTVLMENIAMPQMPWPEVERAVVAAVGEKEVVDISRNDGLSIVATYGWLNVRPSNTEPLLRFVAGAKDKTSGERMIERLRDIGKMSSE